MRDRTNWRTATLRGFAFEDWIGDLFRNLGFEVYAEAQFGEAEVDLLVQCEGVRRPVEISSVRGGAIMAKVRRDGERLRALRALIPEAGVPIVATLGQMSAEARAWAEQQYNIEVWDFDRLRELAKSSAALLHRLESIAGTYQEAPGPAADPTNLDLRGRLAAHIKTNEMTPSDFEDLCLKVFVHLFDPVLYGFEKQASTSDGGNRYDFICRIQPGNSFWDGLRTDFRTKAILFECKNYSNAITADQVYSTERYLFTGALRTVCFLISRLPPAESAIRAAQGAMREAGKLVLLLSNADLIEMLKLRTQPGGPEDYLDKKIWDFIVSLPR